MDVLPQKIGTAFKRRAFLGVTVAGLATVAISPALTQPSMPEVDAHTLQALDDDGGRAAGFAAWLASSIRTVVEEPGRRHRRPAAPFARRPGHPNGSAVELP